MSPSKKKPSGNSGKRKQEKNSAPKRVSQLSTDAELHQTAGGRHPTLTTNQGVALSDNQNSLRANPHGPTLLEDFVLRDKITHFDHERIPKRTPNFHRIPINAPKCPFSNQQRDGHMQMEQPKEIADKMTDRQIATALSTQALVILRHTVTMTDDMPTTRLRVVFG